METIEERLERAKQIAGEGRGLYGYDIIALIEEIERLRSKSKSTIVRKDIKNIDQNRDE